MAPLPPPPSSPPRLPPPPPRPVTPPEPEFGGHVYDHERSRWGIGDALIACAIYLVVSMGLFVVFVAVEGTDSTPREAWLPVLVIVPAVSQFIYVMWIARKKGLGVRADFRAQIRPSDAAVGAALFVSALILAGIAAAAMTELAGEAPTAAVADLIEDSVDEVEPVEPIPQSSGEVPTPARPAPATDSSNALPIWIYVLAVLGATLIPIAEELLFRGLFWSALEKRGVHQIASWAITSVLFALFHFELWRTPVLIVLGGVIGLGRIATGRIGASIFAHMYVNAIGMAALLIELS